MAIYNGVKMSVERASTRHDIFCKLKLNVPLTTKERAIFLTLMATNEQAKEFLRKEKEQTK